MTETFQIPLAAAEIYEQRFVPALFAEWAPVLVDAAGVRPGHAVLDVACGTGVVTREVADRLGEITAVVGLDLNEAMLTVARRLRPELSWQRGDATALPFPPDTFDVVLCQMALMFFEPTTALTEMARVARPGGTVAVLVPASIGEQPAYSELVRVVTEEAGPDAAALMRTYWARGDADDLRRWCTEAGLADVEVQTHVRPARFASVDEMVTTEVESTPLAARLDEATYARIRARARDALARFETPERTVAAPLAARVVTSRA